MCENDSFSENDIRPAKLMKDLANIPNIGDKRKKLLSGESKFVTINCPACGQNEYQPEFEKNRFHYVKCTNCEMVFNNPRPDNDMLEEYYSDNPLYSYWNEEIFLKTEHTRREKIFKPRVDRVVELCLKNKIPLGKLMEIGAGFGTFCIEMQSRDIFRNICAVEPTEALAATCKERGLTTINTPYEKINSEEVNADVIVSFEVIEHLYAPDDFIRFCADSLNNGGMLALSFPNMAGFDTMLLREKSGSVGGEHINMFNHRSIKTVLERYGFKIITIETPGSLDAELMRKAISKGEYDIAAEPFLKRVLIDEWETLGMPFQKFLRDNGLSSHMFVAALKDS